MAKGCDCMKKLIAIVVSVTLITLLCFVAIFWIVIETNPDFAVRFGLASGPGKPVETINTAQTKESVQTTPTGFPSEEVQQPQIMYNGQIYYYFATGFDEPLPDGYSSTGMIEVVDNDHAPESEYQGARVEMGQEIYALPGVHDTIYIKYENGYARFSLKKENKPQEEPDNIPVLTLKSLETACADGFIDPSKVTVLNGEWAYTVIPDKYVALATIKYTNKDNEYETADFVMVGVFDGEVEMYHCLNQHSPYTRENALEAYGAIDDQRNALE